MNETLDNTARLREEGSASSRAVTPSRTDQTPGGQFPSRMRYTDVRRTPTDSGFAQQHVLKATKRDGKDVAVPACLFVAIEDGKIVRIDEYIDSAHVRQITAADQTVQIPSPTQPT